MLVGLYVRDVVLIDQIDLDFAGGLTVLTGETGAGKSILLDALGLALGARAESGLVRPGAERATVSATFAVAANHPARRLLAEHGLADDEALVLRRAVPREGASRAFVNDAPVSAGLLKELGAALVEMQGQHDQQQLLAGAGHRRLLDGFAGLETDVAMVGRAFAELDRARRTLAALADEIARATAEQDLIRHYVAELDALDPKADEEAGLAAMRSLLMAAEKSGEVLREATERLAAVGPGLAAVRQALGRLPDAARPRFAAAAEAVERAEIEATEAGREIDRGMSGIDADPRRLEAVDDRLHALREAARKHRTAPAELPAVRARLRDRLDAIDQGAERLASAEAAVADARAAYRTAADRLSAARRTGAAELDRQVMRELAALMLAKAVFRTRIEAVPEPDWAATGSDRITFEIATLPGVPPGPLSRIASGGELSRILLALKVALAGVGDAPTLIFDEIDAGVGGATADAVGTRLQRVAARHQVLAITHSPQVAARGATHFRIVKAEKAKAGALARIERLDPAARREEVARMLAGARVTDEARAAADRLLGPEPAPAKAAGRR